MKIHTSNTSAFTQVMPCLFITTLLTIMPYHVGAKPINSEQALNNAMAFMQQKGIRVASKNIRRARSLKKDIKEPPYYVFNIGENGGFVIASGDDQVPAILAYADHGSFQTDSLPCNVAYWMKNYEKQIKFIREKGINVASRKTNRAQGGVIGPLLTSKWDQSEPYNETCPIDPKYGVKCVTGCIATAMAQVMYYHRQYSITETTAEIVSVPPFSGPKRVLNVPKGSPIDWDNMRDEYKSYWVGDDYVNDYTTEESHAVAELMRYVGTATELGYSATLTSSFNLPLIPKSLINYFDYDECAKLEKRSDYPDSEWENKIREDLSNGKPIVYIGGNHCFVVDGYDPEGYVHINWGWSGDLDGFFLLGSYYGWYDSNSEVGEAPPEPITYSDEAMGGYSDDQRAVFGAAPYGLYTRLTTLDMNLMSEEEVDLKLTSGFFPISLKTTVTNKNEQGYNFHQAIGLYKNNHLWCILKTLNDTGTLYNGGKKGYSFTINIPDTLSCGTYQIVAMSRVDADERWHPNADRNEIITMMVHDGQAKLVEGIPEVQGDIITFEDRITKTICIENWDFNGDGELSKEEASRVTSLNKVFKGSSIYTFDELQYFTGLTSIGEEDFCDCFLLSDITLPEGLTTIGPRAFRNSFLKKVHISKNIKSIGSEAFRNPEELTVDEDNPYYDSRDNCHGIIETATGKMILGTDKSHVPDGIIIIGKGAFRSCSLDNLTIPEGVVTIEDNAFYGCSRQTSLSLPNSLRSIGNSAFAVCDFTNIDLKNVEEIGDYAFEHSDLTTLVIPASVRHIGKNIIKDCRDITHVEVEDANSYYDSRGGCNALMETKTDKLIAGHRMSVIPSDTKIIGEEAFYYSPFGGDVTLPAGLVSIEDKAFWYCTFIKKLDIPEGVTTIGEKAFEGCYYMNGFSLPSSLTSIGDSAFITNSNKVHHVYVRAKTPLAIPDVFFGHSQVDYLYVPKGSKAAYMAADYWNHFNVIEMTGVRGDLNFDGKVTVADVMILVNNILNTETAYKPLFLCDLNNDNKSTVTDVMQMVEMILKK